MFKKNDATSTVLNDQVKKIVKDIEDGIEEDFNKDDTEQTFFINIEFRKAPGILREVGRLSMPQSDKNDIKKHLIFAVDLLNNALKKLQ
jgi:hypothetical protein